MLTLMTVAKRVFVPCCASSLLTRTSHLLGQVVEYLKRFGSLFSRDSLAFEHFNVLIRQSYRVML